MVSFWGVEQLLFNVIRLSASAITFTLAFMYSSLWLYRLMRRSKRCILGEVHVQCLSSGTVSVRARQT